MEKPSNFIIASGGGVSSVDVDVDVDVDEDANADADADADADANIDNDDVSVENIGKTKKDTAAMKKHRRLLGDLSFYRGCSNIADDHHDSNNNKNNENLNNDKVVEILKSIDHQTQNYKLNKKGEKEAHVIPLIPQSLRFLVANTPSPGENESNKDDPLVLCYVDSQGKLHHYYTYQHGKIDHDEHSYVGDSFVVYLVNTSRNTTTTTTPSLSLLSSSNVNSNNSIDKNSKPENILDLYEDDNNKYTVLLSYRLLYPLDSKEESHFVSYYFSTGIQKEQNGVTNTISGVSCNAIVAGIAETEYRIVVHTNQIPRIPITETIDVPSPPLLQPITLLSEKNNSICSSSSLSSSSSWEIAYTYVCPPIPDTKSLWNPTNQTFYVWGDVDFDDYGNSHRKNISKCCRNIHSCSMNQIVPQVMIGNCLSSNDNNYVPSWKVFHSWVIQAQYYWQTGTGESKAMCGNYVNVNPGDIIRTRIWYDDSLDTNRDCDGTPQQEGTIKVSIAVVVEDTTATTTTDNNSGKRYKEDPQRKSEIVIPRPFPHDPSLFQNWKDFFHRCRDAEEEEQNTQHKFNDNRKNNDNEQKVSVPISYPISNGDGSSDSEKRRSDDDDDSANNHKKEEEPPQQTDRNKIKKGPLCHPCLNVEYKGRVHIETLKSICPFVVYEATLSGLTHPPHCCPANSDDANQLLTNYNSHPSPQWCNTTTDESKQDHPSSFPPSSFSSLWHTKLYSPHAGYVDTLAEKGTGASSVSVSSINIEKAVSLPPSSSTHF